MWREGYKYNSILTKQGVEKLTYKMPSHRYLSENTEAIINKYVQDYVENTKEDVKTVEKVVNTICRQLKSIEDNLYKQESIHPDTFSKSSILGVEKEYFLKVKLIEDLMKSEIDTMFKKT